MENLVRHNYEATNSQLRASLEEVVIGLAAAHASYGGRKGGEAIERLVASGSLPEREGGRMLHGLWQMLHSRGSHPGQSDADETRIRMQLTTGGCCSSTSPERSPLRSLATIASGPGRLIEAVLNPGETGDRLQREAAGDGATATLSKIRELVCE